MRATRLIPLVLVALGVAVVVVVATRGDGFERHVRLTTANATNLFPGLQVRAAGQPVGRVTAVRTTAGGERAEVELAITDRRAWPLPSDTRFVGRFGGTVIYSGRYIQVIPGRATGAPLRDGARVRAANVRMPVEVDQVTDTFGPATRRDLRATVDAAGPALERAGRPLRRALRSAPPTVNELAGVFRDLGSDPSTLRDLVRTTDRVLAAADAADPDLGALVRDGAATFRALGSQSTQVRRALGQLPPSLATARETLGDAERTLTSATALTRRVDPGVRELRSLTPALNATLRDVTAIAPRAVGTLATVRAAAPDVTSLLDRARELTPRVRSVVEEATTQLRCIRPYAPEIAGFASTWSSFVSTGDKKDHYARLYFGSYPFPNAMPLTVPQAAKLLPQAFSSWAFPRPPGANVGQPWFLPECGVTEDALDPQKAVEAQPFDPLSKDLVSTNAQNARSGRKGR